MPVCTSQLGSATSFPSTAPWAPGRFRTASPMSPPMPTAPNHWCISMACSSRPALVLHQQQRQPPQTWPRKIFLPTATFFSLPLALLRRPQLPAQPHPPMPTKRLWPGWRHPILSSPWAAALLRTTSRPSWTRSMGTKGSTIALTPAAIPGSLPIWRSFTIPKAPSSATCRLSTLLIRTNPARSAPCWSGPRPPSPRLRGRLKALVLLVPFQRPFPRASKWAG